MNIEKLSDRAKGFLQSAQTVAIRGQHQRVAPKANRVTRSARWVRTGVDLSLPLCLH